MKYTLLGGNLLRFAAAVPLAALSLFLLTAIPASAMKIQKIISKKGIEAWLVEDHSRPILSLQFAFDGGASQDPADKPGIATFVSGMLDEGSGDLEFAAFQNRMEDSAAKMNVIATRDNMMVTFQMLSQNREESLSLLKKALTSPHFDALDAWSDPGAARCELRPGGTGPQQSATNAWFKLAFGSHPTASP